MSKTNYPLQWPTGWRREQQPQFSKFKPMSPYAESIEVGRQLALLGATEVVITSNMQYKNDGTPYARQGYLNDTGVAVYFKLAGEEQCIPCDKWRLVEENLRAIAKTVEALRGLERWGAKDMVNAAFRGFKALPGSIVTPPPKQDWWVVLNVAPNAGAHEVKAAYRELVKLHHPDQGGSQEDFQAIKQAYEDWKMS